MNTIPIAPLMAISVSASLASIIWFHSGVLVLIAWTAIVLIFMQKPKS